MIGAPAPTELTVMLEAVSGVGNEKNWKIFQELFRETAQADLLDSFIDRQKTLKLRLIKKGENPIGIVVYASKLTQDYAVMKLNFAFHVVALHVKPLFDRAVREALIDQAMEMDAIHMVINVLKSDEPLKNSLKECSFRKIDGLISDRFELFAYNRTIDSKKEKGQGWIKKTKVE